MTCFKPLALAAALAAAATPSLAGGFAPAVVEPEPVVVVEPTATRPVWGILLPLLLLGAVAVVATQGDDDDGDDNGNGVDCELTPDDPECEPGPI